jgi:hypothetical protein
MFLIKKSVYLLQTRIIWAIYCWYGNCSINNKNKECMQLRIIL